jgi:type I restriction enzyme, S subunit
MSTSQPVIYQLKIVLQGISPMIWRRPLVCGDNTIADLHYIVQISMGWSDDHLHPFRIQVEGLKSRYQQSLADLESLYGALSQKAFKGELDLSRVPLPEQKPDEAAHETKVPEAANESELSEMMVRFSKLDMAAMSSAEGREHILKQWFGEWLNDTAAKQEFSSDHFWQRARYSALDYQDDDDTNIDFSLQDYDLFKQWLFDAIVEGRIEQTRKSI